ncbi:MAG: carboxylating nicotinate-nucleotide diphosphorylase, partial [Calditrichia bacterium]
MNAPSKEQIQNIIDTALAEDIGNGDVTTAAIVPTGEIFKGKFTAKADGVVAGLTVAEMVFQRLDQKVNFKSLIREGEKAEKGETIAEVEVSAQALLSGERVALNFLQRMSGIATLTSRFVEAVRGTGAKILDTRKTVPGLRLLDKWAVRIGGGNNHRFGLYDMALIKENHVTVAGSISRAVERVRSHSGSKIKIEVEVR